MPKKAAKGPVTIKKAKKLAKMKKPKADAKAKDKELKGWKITVRVRHAGAAKGGLYKVYRAPDGSTFYSFKQAIKHHRAHK